ncbi:glycerophosphodiester phosphodiesterase family protein [Halobacteriovorax sp. GB3]|uniref:glycerophosphodiester phosphodiesterase n=1 Tax=Halobacteriovorax sp. GB3 TaxID=2719615 RepID=UPI00235E50F3|nr:glycerophosphodiester phosphodiesterase family protein [Halobacteriovorax sp. GB3]MDD0851623.1 glycerophosphodiester phosphodiesterase family protein [Halobacteriovorax sp. GB3]
MKITIFTLLFTIIHAKIAVANVLPIAHRGASAYAPENTVSAIKKAIELGAKYIEIDVHMTKDGEVVAIHDSTIDRTSSGSGKVSDLNLTKLKEIDFGSWFSSKFKDERIPTLEEVLKITGNKSVLIIELKNGHDDYPNIEKKIVNLVEKMGLGESVILKSFSFEILNRFKQLAPDLERLYCTFGGTSWVTLDNFLRFKNIFKGSSFQYLQVHKYFLTDWIVSEARKRNIKVVVWDVHDKATMSEMVEKGVDFIESDNPDYVINL